MSTHYTFNQGLPSGARLRGALNLLEAGKNNLTLELATMTAALDGDGSDIGHFANVVAEYGFSSTTTAKAAWEEISSALSKINNDSPQTSTDSALKQLFTWLR